MKPKGTRRTWEEHGRAERLEALARELREAARKMGAVRGGARLALLRLATEWAMKARCTREHSGFNRGNQLGELFGDLRHSEQQRCAGALGMGVSELRRKLAEIESELALAPELVNAGRAKRTATMLDELVKHLTDEDHPPHAA